MEQPPSDSPGEGPRASACLPVGMAPPGPEASPPGPPACLLRGRQAPRGPAVLLGIIILAYTLGFFWAARVRYLNFHFSQDAANFDHMLWRTAHGDFLPSYLYGACHLADHASFFLLLIAPLYALAPGMSTLLLLQSACLGASAVPLFLIARRAFRRDLPAILAAAAYLLHPGIVSQNMNQVHEVQFIIGLLLAAFYCLEAGRFGWFVVFCAAATLGKETVPLTVFMFGVYALLRRRRARWVLFPIGFSLLYLHLVVGVLIPRLWGGPYRHWHHFLYYGATGPEVLGTMISRPSMVLSIAFTPQKMQYVRELFGPCAFGLPLLGPAAIMSLPDFLVNMLAAEPALAVVEWHYSVVISAFLCVGAVQGIRFVKGLAPARWRPAAQWGLVVLWLAATLLSRSSWAMVSDTRPPPDAAARRAVLAQVPADPGVSVVAPQTLVARLAERYTILTPQQEWADLAKADCIIVDENDELYRRAERRRVRDALSRGRHVLVWREGSWSIYRRPAE